MRKDTIVQFVSFETSLNTEEFIVKWEQFNRSFESDLDVILQQSQTKANLFKYLAQHRLSAGDFRFTFSKGKKSSRAPEAEIRTRQIGGYSILFSQRKNTECLPDESKLFVFVTDPTTDLNVFKKILAGGALNIYEAFYENCTYQYILKFFAKDEEIDRVLQQLKPIHTEGLGVYKECLLRLT